MGQEIVYCFKCQTRLKGEEFEKGSAFRIGDKTCCATCAVGLLTSLPPEEQQAILAKVMNSPNATTKKLVVDGEVIEPGGPQTPAPSPTTPRPGDGTGKVRLASTPRTIRAAAAVKKSTQRLIAGEGKMLPFMIGGGLAVAALIGILVVMGGGRGRSNVAAAPPSGQPETAPLEHYSPSEARTPDKPPPEPVGGRTRLPSAAAREETAKKSLDKARAADPADVASKVRLYQQAVWDSEGTPFFDEATKELAPLLEKWKARLASELSALDDAVRAAADKEEFKSAQETLDKARRTHADADWTAPIDRKIATLRNQIDDTYRTLKEKAIDAKRRGESTDSMTQRVATWGLGDYAADLTKALADVTAAPAAKPTVAPAEKPAPKPEDEGVTYRARWEHAMSLASTRDYAGATVALEQAAGPIQDSTLRGEALGDLEIIRMVAAMYGDTMDLLAEWPEGRPMPLKYVDEAGNRKSVSEAVVHATRHRVELKKGKTATQWVEFSDVEADTLAKLYKGRKNKQKTDGKAAAYFCLFEGEEELAKSVLGEPVGGISEKYWALARKIKDLESKAPKPDAESAKKERDAREILYAAEKEFRSMATLAGAIDKYKTLLGSYAETPLVKKNQAFLTKRSDGDKEYLFTAEDVKGAGSIRLNRDKDGAFWLSEFDTEDARRRENYLDIDFYAAPGQQYRIYVFTGSCCIEVASFHLQATDLQGTVNGQANTPIEPGGTVTATLQFRNDKLPSTHAAHGGRKEPTHWQWWGIPVPRYAAPGVKKVRLLTTQMGLGFRYVVVTSTRATPPPLSEIRKAAAER